MSELLQNAVASLTSNIPKAILCVYKPDKDSTSKSLSSDADSLRQSIMSLTSDALTLGTQYSSVVNSGYLENNNFVALEVQYNPNTIYISNQGTGETVNYMGGNMGDAAANQLVQSFLATVRTLQCQLIFDAVNISDAFMSTDISGSFGSVASSVSSIVNKVTTGKSGYSVQTQVDGLMSLLTQPSTRQVVFIWGKMFFEGELVGVDSTYTMFNKYGDPIRGVVNLTISELGSTASEVEYWNDAFDRGFSDSSASGISSVVNNSILNLNL